MSGEPASTADAPSRVVLLGQDGPSTRAVFHALAQEFPDVGVILEAPASRWRLARRRAKRLGVLPVIGQVLFITVVVPVLKRRGRNRIQHVTRSNGLDASPISGDVIEVPSVNSEQARAALRRLNPAAVVVNGTRIIGAETLNSVDAPFINIHAGITPLSRGVHGGYWALAEGRRDLVGTTVHLVDDGIDTGRVLARVTFPVEDQDSFATYPYLHLAYGIPELLRVVREAVNGGVNLAADQHDLPSRLRYHPTLWGYLATRITKGVR